EDGKPLLLTDVPDERVEMVVRGPIVADENFRTYTVSVSQKERTMSVYGGYKKDPAKSTKLYNSSEAFTQFVYALEKAGMTGQVDGAGDDTRGVCASGDLITFNVYKKDELKKSLWTSTCSGAKGSLKGDVGRLQRLFSNQIPEYSSLLSKTGLN
ncbi:MAG: hypothetical protein LBL84_01865, partial [Candidatus Nomurabacteria bacterium]|nr:hypothetical protein [Candidatus Nomurabacteria bacterium]